MNRNQMWSSRVEVDLTLMFNFSQSTERSGLMILQIFEFQNYRCQKSYHRDNWLVAAKRSQRRRFLILRCRLFLPLSCIRDKRLDCSPTNRERELGLDRRETGQFYPTITYITIMVRSFSTRGTVRAHLWYIKLIDLSMSRSCYGRANS